MRGGPIRTIDVDVGGPVGALAPAPGGDGAGFTAVQVLVRLHRHPVGIVLIEPPGPERWNGGVDADVLATRIWSELGDALRAHVLDDGLPEPRGMTMAGLPGPGPPPCSWRERLGPARPRATVCIATCGRSVPKLLRTIRSALDQTYDDAEVLVVDNRPGRSGLPGPLVDAFGGESRLYYVTEPRPGLAAVRNRSALEAGTEIVALTDDDVVLDPDWLGFLVAGFDRPEVACVTGLILPSELETSAQIYIEEFGGFSKGFRRARWDLDHHRLDHPLYPYLFGMYGSGANAAWRRAVLEDLGGYDIRLGTGTPARGGEDLDIYLSCVLGGHQLVYEPAAVVHHEHRREVDLLRKQVFDYGVGLGAVVTKRLLGRADRSEMATRLRAGLGYLLSPTSPKNAGKSKQFPRSLTAAELVGIAYGPLAYLKSRRSP